MALPYRADIAYTLHQQNRRQPGLRSVLFMGAVMGLSVLPSHLMAQSYPSSAGEQVDFLPPVLSTFFGSAGESASDSTFMTASASNPASRLLDALGIEPVTSLDSLPELPDIHAPAQEADSTFTVPSFSAPQPSGQVVELGSSGVVAPQPVQEVTAPTYVNRSRIVETVTTPAPQQPQTTAPSMRRISGDPSLGNAIPPKRGSGFAPTDISAVAGAGVIYRPDYLGSDDHEVAPKILFDVSYQDRLFLSSKQGLGFIPYKSENLYTDVHVVYWRGRGDDGDLEGMEAIDPGMAFGGTVGLRSRFADLDLTMDWGAFGGNTGMEATASVSRWFDVTPAIAVRPRAYVTVANRDYMDTQFGVTAAESADVNLAMLMRDDDRRIPTYDPSGGLKDMGVSLDLEYAFAPTFSLLGSGAFYRLGDEAANSPLVDILGQRSNWELSLMGVYRF